MIERRTFSLTKGIISTRDINNEWETNKSLPCAYKPDLFSKTDTKKNQPLIEEAKQYCKYCPKKEICLTDALKNDEKYVRGGTTEKERKQMKTNIQITD